MTGWQWLGAALLTPVITLIVIAAMEDSFFGNWIAVGFILATIFGVILLAGGVP